MKGVDKYVVTVGSNEINKTGAHGICAGFGEGKSQDGVGGGVSIFEYIGDAEGEGLSFTSAWTGDDHDRTFGGIDCQFLLMIERVV